MKAKLTMCVGLPGSGKTTWALEQANTSRINQDDIRKELGWTSWATWDFKGPEETLTHTLKRERIATALGMGFHVISDDTNLGRQRKVEMEALAREYSADFAIQDFTKVAVEECIRRDGLRLEHARVGERVIRKMAASYGLDVSNDPAFLYTRFTPVGKQDLSLSRAIICDLDGTLALFSNKGHRGPYDATRCAEDEVNVSVLTALDGMASIGRTIVYLSGREAKYAVPTHTFLKLHAAPGHERPHLYMRETGDKRKDWIVKGELFDTHIRGKYYIDFVLDDRNQVVNFWRHLGLTCFQVAEGNF